MSLPASIAEFAEALRAEGYEVSGKRPRLPGLAGDVAEDPAPEREHRGGPVDAGREQPVDAPAPGLDGLPVLPGRQHDGGALPDLAQP